MEFIDKNRNDKFSDLRGLDLKELIYQIECFDLEYRDILNLTKKLTFGIEIEYENYDKIHVDKFINKNFSSWYSTYDGSLTSGGELISPILTDTKQTWKELRKICTHLKENQAINKRSGAHIHVGAHILGKEKQYWINIVKLYTIYESIMFRFFYGDKLNARVNIFRHAEPVANLLKEVLPELQSQKYLNCFDDLLTFGSRYNAINFCNVSFSNGINEEKHKNTIELRCPNGTIEEVIWQNNINTFSKLILASKSENLDQEYLDYNIKEGVIDPDTKFYLYNEIRLKAALEFVDTIFNNNLDKVYFLKQYLKGFESNYGLKELTKAKKFIK